MNKLIFLILINLCFANITNSLTNCTIKLHYKRYGKIIERNTLVNINSQIKFLVNESDVPANIHIKNIKYVFGKTTRRYTIPSVVIDLSKIYLKDGTTLQGEGSIIFYDSINPITKFKHYITLNISEEIHKKYSKYQEIIFTEKDIYKISF